MSTIDHISMGDPKQEKLGDNMLAKSETLNTVQNGIILEEDAVFGTVGNGKPNYRNVSLFGTVAVMVKITIGFGVLSIPGSFDKLGLNLGIFCLIAVGIVTTWASHVVGVFKQLHPNVYGVDDAGHLMFGVAGRETLAMLSVSVSYIFVSGSGMLSISIALNALSEHGTCTAVSVAVAAAAIICLASIRAPGKIQAFAWVGITSIIVAVFIVTIAVGVQGGPDQSVIEGHELAAID